MGASKRSLWEEAGGCDLLVALLTPNLLLLGEVLRVLL